MTVMMGPEKTAFILLLSSLLSTHTLHAKSLSSDGRRLSVSVGGARRLRRDLHDSLPYEGQMMSYPTSREGGANELYYQPDEWSRRGFGQALQRLVESDQRREQQQEEEAAYVAKLLRLLSDARSMGLVSPDDVDAVQEEEDDEDEDQGFGGYERAAPPDYDDVGRAPPLGKVQDVWWRLLLDRLEPQLAQALSNQVRLQVAGSGSSGRPGVALSDGLSRATDRDALRYAVARILSSIGPQTTSSSSHRMRRDLSLSQGGGGARVTGPAHKRSRRSLDDATPLPSIDPPLLRVKRLEEEGHEGGEEGGHITGLQRMKRIDTMATDELHAGSRSRKRRAALLVKRVLQYMDE